MIDKQFSLEKPVLEQAKEKENYFKNAPYPEHLKELQRLSMMLDIIKHEIKKQPGLSDDEYKRREQEINGWLSDPEKYQMGGGLRDVMNKIWADFTGFKLKFGTMEILTASNIHVSAETLPLDELLYMDYFTTKVLEVAGKDGSISGTTGSMTVGDVRKYLKEHQEKFTEIKDKTDSSFEINSTPRENDNILVYRTKGSDGQERLTVLDGNGRLTRNMTQSPDDKEKKVSAWVVTRIDDEPLRDYWIPTIRFADKLEEASRAKSDEKKKSIKEDIFDLFNISPGVGPIELERAASVNPLFAKEVLQEWAALKRKEV